MRALSHSNAHPVPAPHPPFPMPALATHPLGANLFHGILPQSWHSGSAGVGQAYPSHASVVEEAASCDRACHVVLEQGPTLRAHRVAAELAVSHHTHGVRLRHCPTRLASCVQREVGGCDV